MNAPRGPLPPNNSDMLLDYLVIMAVGAIVWLCASLFVTACMVVVARAHPLDALIRGLAWGLIMWVLMSSLMAISLMWRRSAVFPAPDQAAFRTALERACRKLRLIVLAESGEEIVLGPRWVPIRLRAQEVWIKLAEGVAVLTAPALSFGAVRKAVARALAEAAADAEQVSRDQRNAERVAAPDRPRDGRFHGH